ARLNRHDDRMLRELWTIVRQLREPPEPLDVEALFHCFTSAHFRWVHQHWKDVTSFEQEPVAELERGIISAVREGRPYALVRLGDGEGSFVSELNSRVGGATVNGSGPRRQGRMNERGVLTRREHSGLAAAFLEALTQVDSV